MQGKCLMNRTDEALLSRGNITISKTIYVEGKLDKQIISDFLKNNNIKGVSIVPIVDHLEMNELNHFELKEKKMIKQKLISFIKKSNDDITLDKRFIGIIDLDYDTILGKVSVDNLFYTDMNCIESYLIDKDIIADHLENNSTLNQDAVDIQKLINKFSDLNLLFYFQIVHYETLKAERMISFEELSMLNVPWVCKETFNIDINKIIDIKGSNKIKELFPTFKSEQKDSLKGLENIHGKYLLSYIISFIKQNCPNCRKISEDNIKYSIKDRFIINKKYTDYSLFEKIKAFAHQ